MARLRTLLRHAWEPYVLLPGVAGAIVVVIWALTLTILRKEASDADAAALQATERLMDTYEAQTLRVLNEVQQSLRLVAYARRFAGGNGDLAQLQAQNLLLPNMFFTTRLVDARGQVLASSRAGGLQQPVSPEVVAHHARSGEVFVSRPYRAPGMQEPVIDVSRRSGEATGSEIIVVTMPAGYLVSDYDEARFGSSGVLAVVGDDGVFRARRTGGRVDTGGAVDFRRLVPAAAERQGQAALQASPWDGVPRYTAARRLYAFPLAVVVALPESERMAPFHAAARKLLVQAWTATAVVAGVTLALSLLTRHIRILRRRERLAIAEHARRVEYLAYHDSLTSLPNRAHFKRALSDRLAMAREDGQPFAVLLLDLDGFKKVNDVHGHHTGDLLLVQVAQRLAACVREGDLVARLGGDEFVVILAGRLSPQEIDAVAGRIVAEVARPYALDGIPARVTTSVGVAVYPQDGTDEDTLTRMADQAMYLAKERGKNMVQYAQSLATPALPAAQAPSAEAEVRRAIEDDWPSQVHLSNR